MTLKKKKLAVLIDADNVTPKVANGLFAEIAKYGTASLKRIYGDWTTPALKGWKECLLEHSIQPIQQFSYTSGKNSTDGALIIDAMDLLYSSNFAGFCIVSSDSDFVRLATRIREQGLTVIGFGERRTPRPFITSCDKFVYFDILNASDRSDTHENTVTNARKNPNKSAPKTEPAIDSNLLKMLKIAIEATSEDEGISHLSKVGSHLAKQAPDFNSRKYGYKQLSALIKASGIATIDRVGENPTRIHVSLK